MATIKKTGKSYQIRVYNGYDITGKQIERRMSWTPPPDMSEKKAYKEAQRQAYLFEEQVKSGQYTINGKIKFAAFTELWLKNHAMRNLRPRTVNRYKELLRAINPAIGHLPLEKIAPLHLLDFYAKLEDSEPENATYQCTIDLMAKVKAINMTLVAFSQKTGVSLSTLRTAKKNLPISKATAEKICSGLDTSLSSYFQPTKPGKKLAPTTIRHYHALISSILGTAIEWQYLLNNPCDRITAPKKNAPPLLYLDDMQTKQFVQYLRTETGLYRRLSLLLLMTGIRRGELLGLEWQDVDWKDSTIRIERTSQYIAGRGLITDETKNESSHRTIEVSSQVIKILQEQYLWQQMQKNRLKREWIDSNRVATNENGTPMRPDRLTAWFRRFIDKTDLPPITIHSLRHTYATLLIAHGAPITAVSAQLGHASVATTANIYAHAIKTAQIAASRIIGNLLDEYI